jgi:predicted nucleic acid-binding protein
MICLDSSFIIDFLRNKPGAVKKASEMNEYFAVTSTSVYEVMVGFSLMKNSNEEKINKFVSFLGDCEILSLDLNASLLSSEIYSDLVSKGQMIEDFDCLIAGTMKSNQVNRIITGNEKHFKKIKEVSVISY